ncbi:ankyrin repeat-containing domain protein [Colletotrichum cereale]|nr:ankyrin repeat-containing domain protein [Colletotrichum cereale]
MVEEADVRGTSTDQSLPETPLLKRARLQLSDIAADLEVVHRDCVRAVREDGKVEPKKTKWFLQQKRLSECRDKARDARENLLAALQMLLLREVKETTREAKETKQLVLRIESITIERHGAMALMSSSSKDSYGSSRQLQGPQVCDMVELHRPQQEKSINQVTAELGQLAFSGNGSKKANKRTPRGSDSIIINASLSTLDKCPQPCGCRCHGARAASYRSAAWARTLIGSVSLSYRQQLACNDGAKCNSKTCKGSGKASAHVSYCFPAWLCSRLVSIQASLDASGGISASLRPVRILLPSDGFWSCVRGWSRMELRQLMHHEGIVYPGDIGSNGQTVWLNVIQFGTADIVAYLADLWGEQLNSDSFDDTWFFEANRYIEDSSYLHPEKRIALRSMVSHNEGRVDAVQTPLHSAVRQADLDKMQQAAKSQPWSMMQIDHCGEAPLHVAVRLGNVDVARELLELGCDVDQRDGIGNTVLITACKWGHVPMVQYLLDAGCIVDAKNKFELTALHCATLLRGESLTETIGSLLSAGASTTTTNLDGHSVLHGLVWSDSDKDTIGVALRMLLKAGANLEARDCVGKTPLVTAIEWSRPVALQCFVEAGASTATFGPLGNILHRTALNVNHDTLSYLESLSLSEINLDHVDKNGNTVWDYWIWVSYAENWRIGGNHRPSLEEQQAFVRLYQGVRDRNLDFDIKTLQRVRRYALHEDQRGATAALAPLIAQKEEWKRWSLVETYNAIRLQIREAMWEAAIESVDENIEVLLEEMAKSPWENSSHYDFLI